MTTATGLRRGAHREAELEERRDRPDAEDYDPTPGREVFITKWMTADDIAVLYNKEDADYLRGRDHSSFMYGYDSVQTFRDRFGDSFNPMYSGGYDDSSVPAQHARHRAPVPHAGPQKFFVSPEGDMRPVPEDFDREQDRVVRRKYGFQVTTKLVRRIRWTVMCRQRRAARRLEPVQALHGGAVLPVLPPGHHDRPGREPAGPPGAAQQGLQPGAARRQHHGEQRLEGQGRQR
jgi:hypothetical protein